MENSSGDERIRNNIDYRSHYRGHSADSLQASQQGTIRETTIVPEYSYSSDDLKLQYTLEGHTKRIYILAWSPDGKLLASGSRDTTVRLWDTTTGSLRHVLEGHKDWILCIAWSPDGKLLASGSHDKTVRLWDTTTGSLRHVLKGHDHRVSSIAWSPDGRLLASGSQDKTVWMWDTTTGEVQHILKGHTDAVIYVAWSPEGKLLATGSSDKTVRLWDTTTGSLRHVLRGHTHRVNFLSWSPNSELVASGSGDKTVRLWNATTGTTRHILKGHAQAVLCIAWSPNSELVASGSEDRTVRLWNATTGAARHILEGHTSTVWSVDWSSDGKLLASGANNRLHTYDAEVRIWRTDTWEALEPLSDLKGSLHAVWHPSLPIVATPGPRDQDFLVWNLNQELLFQTKSLPEEKTLYKNAKVVLVGESGFGKTALSLVLNNQPYKPTDSSHGRSVWPFDSREVLLPDGRKETRETLLWDLAGQSGYRLLHQLHLNEVTMALVVFDAHSETDPFAGVEYWCRALDQAQRVRSSSLPLKKLLVHARNDRGKISASPQRIEETRNKFGLDGGFFSTSAKEGKGIVDLQKAIHEGIDWEALPGVTSTKLFQQIKQFLIREKQSGRLLPTEKDLYATLLQSKDAPEDTPALVADFETCIGRIESAGLIKRLSFGQLVLLQPEILDSYASALIDSVKSEPDGLGHITEIEVRECNFSVPDDERIEDQEQESLLLIAMIEDLLRSELALREGEFLVFPSQSTRENPDLPDPEGQRVVFTFEGPIYNIYATLAVRLSHSDFFEKKDLWKNAITYTAKAGGTCGLFLYSMDEGRGKLTLFFDQKVSEETVFNFDEFVREHMQRHVGESFIRQYLFSCNSCHEILSDNTVQRRKERGFDWLNCPVCEKQISLLDGKERLATEKKLLGVTSTQRIIEMNQAADNERESAIHKSTIDGKQATKDFDVYLCYNDADQSTVECKGEELKEQGILPWFDAWELKPGSLEQRIREKQIRQTKSVAIFIGGKGINSRQDLELQACIRKFTEQKDYVVIPVLLEDYTDEIELPEFLKNIFPVDFRRTKPNQMELLCKAIPTRNVDEEIDPEEPPEDERPGKHRDIKTM